MEQDLEHLRLLSVFHYVVAGLAALFGALPLLHLILGLGLVAGWVGDGEAQARVVGCFFIAFGLAFVAAALAFAAALALAGRWLARRRRYTFCLVMAGLACAFTPFGTVLGVLTLIVLLRPSVRELFEAPGEAITG